MCFDHFSAPGYGVVPVVEVKNAACKPVLAHDASNSEALPRFTKLAITAGMQP
jgi:hypothetical protein